jgi:hypothetical protein
MNMRLATSLLLVSFAAVSLAQQGPLPKTSNGTYSFVLARVVARKVAPAGQEWRTDTPEQKTEIKWASLTLETLDRYLGEVPDKFEVAIPQYHVDYADRAAARTPGGGVGFGPFAGLQVGDVAAWPIQKVRPEGFFYRVVPTDQGPVVENSVYVMTAPGHTYAYANHAEGPRLMAGNFLLFEKEPLPLPAYEASLPPLHRYAQLTIRAAAAHQQGAWDQPMTRIYWWGRLYQLGQELGVNRPDRQDTAKWMLAELTTQVKVTTDEDKLHMLALQMHWRATPSPEAQFLALYKKLGSKSLHMPRPPIKSESFYIEECESDEASEAIDGFMYMRENKSRDNRVLKAALRWLDRPSSVKRGQDVVGVVLSYLSAVSNGVKLAYSYEAPTSVELDYARKLARRLLEN